MHAMFKKVYLNRRKAQTMHENTKLLKVAVFASYQPISSFNALTSLDL